MEDEQDFAGTAYYQGRIQGRQTIAQARARAGRRSCRHAHLVAAITHKSEYLRICGSSTTDKLLVPASPTSLQVPTSRKHAYLKLLCINQAMLSICSVNNLHGKPRIRRESSKGRHQLMHERTCSGPYNPKGPRRAANVTYLGHKGQSEPRSSIGTVPYGFPRRGSAEGLQLLWLRQYTVSGRTHKKRGDSLCMQDSLSGSLPNKVVGRWTNRVLVRPVTHRPFPVDSRRSVLQNGK